MENTDIIILLTVTIAQERFNKLGFQEKEDSCFKPSTKEYCLGKGVYLEQKRVG